MYALKNIMPYAGVLVLGLLIGAVLMHLQAKGKEGFVDITQTDCEVCQRPGRDCCASGCGGCRRPGGDPDDHRKCPAIDWSKYVLKASIPPCPPQPDMSRYMLKTECPAPPDMSKYVLKSAVPPCPPCISTCNKPCKIGDCPPCPRPRCPVVTCPKPTECPPCAAVEPPRCPEPSVTCKADYKPEDPWMVRPLLASISPM
jgi:hypothetical protein